MGAARELSVQMVKQGQRGYKQMLGPRNMNIMWAVGVHTATIGWGDNQITTGSELGLAVEGQSLTF